MSRDNSCWVDSAASLLRLVAKPTRVWIRFRVGTLKYYMPSSSRKLALFCAGYSCFQILEGNAWKRRRADGITISEGSDFSNLGVSPKEATASKSKQ